MKQSSAHLLKKSYFGGGTVQVALAREDFHVKKTQLEDRSVNANDIGASRV